MTVVSSYIMNHIFTPQTQHLKACKQSFSTNILQKALIQIIQHTGDSMKQTQMLNQIKAKHTNTDIGYILNVFVIET